MLGHEVSEEEVVQMVQVFDTDGSGDIGFPEFVQLIRQQVLVNKDPLKCLKNCNSFKMISNFQGLYSKEYHYNSMGNHL
jgi:Ca2+-binding EF-hand superfamily protein